MRNLIFLVKADLDIIHHTTHLISSTILSNQSLLSSFYNFKFSFAPSSPSPALSSRVARANASSATAAPSSPAASTYDPFLVTIKDIIFEALLTCPVDGIRTYFANCFELLCTGILPDDDESVVHPITFFAELLVSKFPWPSSDSEEYSEAFYSAQYFAFLGKLIVMDKDKVFFLNT